MLDVFDLLPLLLTGAVVTVQITVMGGALALVMAFAAGLGRLSRSAPIRWLSTVYVEFFRGTSALIQLFWLFYALPLLGVSLDPMVAAVIGLGLNIGSYGAEVVRGAVLAVPRGQYEAARALGFSRAQMLRRILVPQAIPAMVPPFGNLWIELLKATALVSLITLGDLTFQAQMLRTATLQTPLIFGTVLFIYFALAMVMVFIIRRIERRVGRGLDRGGMRT
ncbi:ectoine/hydroxyectoine ABC transporter permease subunit EhuC [Telmatospirillum sp. J64-1]|uniref:ectoine/hydroxyectoine ABC transporter permease subunit EhuC n=1 Tax=Telmatospirillum sp. J64-1 TaxID=2502183 RepID=UPI00115CCAAC|nr:ectoine/hydroxyectoine ABC transporter permease subunit EhuC [Telmatospirillum sp. J64-1]